jgi:hypothetical protein
MSSRGEPIKGGPTGWGLGFGTTNPSRKNKLITHVHSKSWTWTDSFDKRPKRKKMDMIDLAQGTSGGLL